MRELFFLSVVAAVIGLADDRRAYGQADFNVAQARKSVVFIKRITPGLAPASGSGFFAEKDGLIYTNRHVAVPDDDKLKGTILLVGVPSAKDPDVLDYFKAEVVFVPAQNNDLDFAVLKIAAKPGYGEFRPLPLSLAKLDLGAPVAVLGFPPIKDDEPPLSFNKGSISATRVKFDGLSFYQIDAAVNPGNSGGPMLNVKGEVVGIVTLRKPDARNMGYALYLSEITKAVESARTLAEKIKPELGPFNPEKLPTLPVIAAKKANWDITNADVSDLKGSLTLDKNGGNYWITSKEPLPSNFQLVIPCQIAVLQGGQNIQPSQFSILRSLIIRFATDDTNANINSRNGYTLRLSHNLMLFYKEGAVLKNANKGNTTDPFTLIITKRGGKITIARNSEVLMEVEDPEPIGGAYKFSIGGYLSRLRIGDVSITKFDDEPSTIKKIEPPAKKFDVPAGGLGNPAPKLLSTGDVTLHHLTFSTMTKGSAAYKVNDKILGDIIWAKDGKSFYMLHELGVLQHINVQTGQTQQLFDLQHKCGNLAMSGEGLLVSVIGTSQVWVVNPDKISDVKKKIAVPGISRIAAGGNASIAWAANTHPSGRGLALTAVDVKAGVIKKTHPNIETWLYAVTPDAKYVMISANGVLGRYLVKDDDLIHEETSYGIGGNNTRRICISNDSQYVAMPSAPGNGNPPNHPTLRFATYVYPITNLKRPATVYAAGGLQFATGIDPISRCILGQAHDKPLIVYGFSADYKLGEYNFKSVDYGGVHEFAISPLGGEALVRLERNGLVHVKINKPGPDLEVAGSLKVPDPKKTLIGRNVTNPAPTPFHDGDVTLRQLTFTKTTPADVVGNIVWAKNGKAFYMLTDLGILQRIDAKTGITEQMADIHHKCAALGMSAEGLVVSLIGREELWVIDADEIGTVIRRISVPGLIEVCTAPESSYAWIGLRHPNGRGLVIHAVDLITGAVQKTEVKGTKEKFETWFYAVTPNGKYVFSVSSTALTRFRAEGHNLVFEQSSYNICGNNARAISFSNDSQYVVLAAHNGNGDHPDHPRIFRNPTYVYPVINIKVPVTGFSAEWSARAPGIDPISRTILAQGFNKPLITYGFAINQKLAEYDLKPLYHKQFAEYVISPLGSEAIGRSEIGIIIHVKINKAGPTFNKSDPPDAPDPKKLTAGKDIVNPEPKQLFDGDVTLRNLTFSKNRVHKILDSIVWAKDGKSFYMLQEFGLLQRIDVRTGRTEMFLEIGQKCGNLAMSGEGLLVSVLDKNEVWIIDPDDVGTVKKKIAVPAITMIFAGVEASTAWAGGESRPGIAIHAVDLKAGVVAKTHTRLEKPVQFAFSFGVTPNGKYLFTASPTAGMSRFLIKGNDLVFDENGFRVGTKGRFVFSNDSQYVALPTGGGNGNHPNHPKLGVYGTFVYSVTNLRVPATGYSGGAYPRAVGIDPISRSILAQNRANPLLVYGFAVDQKLGGYDFKSVDYGEVHEFAISPFGSEAIARTERDGLVHIKINKAGPKIEH